MSGFGTKRISKRRLRGLGLAALVVVAASCTRHSHWVEEDFANAADFSSLNCQQLDVAEISTLQRMSAISPIIDQAAARDRRAVLFGPVGWAIAASEVPPPEVQEYSVLKAERLLITGERGRKNCEALRLAQLQAPTSPAPSIALDDARTEPTPKAAAKAKATAAVGNYLQVGSFADPANATATIRKIQDKGLPVDLRPIEIASKIYRRVLIGPISGPNQLEAAIMAAGEMGLADAFVVKG